MTLHLARADDLAGEEEVAGRVLELLRRRSDPGAPAWLAGDPELLASVFQNADLLYAHGFADADAVSLLVMRALETAGRSP